MLLRDCSLAAESLDFGIYHFDYDESFPDSWFSQHKTMLDHQRNRFIITKGIDGTIKFTLVGDAGCPKIEIFMSTFASYNPLPHRALIYRIQLHTDERK